MPTCFGIHKQWKNLDSGFRRNDDGSGFFDFLRFHQPKKRPNKKVR